MLAFLFSTQPVQRIHWRSFFLCAGCNDKTAKPRSLSHGITQRGRAATKGFSIRRFSQIVHLRESAKSADKNFVKKTKFYLFALA